MRSSLLPNTEFHCMPAHERQPSCIRYLRWHTLSMTEQLTKRFLYPIVEDHSSIIWPEAAATSAIYILACHSFTYLGDGAVPPPS
jgi:hypothetical protein